MSDVTIEDGATIEYSIIDERTVVKKNAIIGDSIDSGKGIALLGRDIVIDEGVKINGGDIIDNDVREEK